MTLRPRRLEIVCRDRRTVSRRRDQLHDPCNSLGVGQKVTRRPCSHYVVSADRLTPDEIATPFGTVSRRRPSCGAGKVFGSRRNARTIHALVASLSCATH